MKNFSIIIPIFNESESIFELIDEIILVFGKNLPEIIIVDDGSTDNFKKKKDKIENKTLIFSHKNNLGKCKAMYTGAAPVTQETLDYFCSLDIPILELYGMSECTGPACINILNYHKFGSCGTVIPGCEIKIFHGSCSSSNIFSYLCYE